MIRLVKNMDLAFLASPAINIPKGGNCEVVATREGDDVDLLKLTFIFFSIYTPFSPGTIIFTWSEELLKNFCEWTSEDIKSKFDPKMIEQYKDFLDISGLNRKDRIRLAQSCL